MTNNLHDDWGDDGGLGPTFDAYADARLRADPERTGVVRSRVVGAARSQARHQIAPASVQSARRRRFAFPRVARTPLLAAASLILLSLAAGGALAATAPGGPLYGARLWVEEAQLPVAPQAREDAQLDRLDDRLEEARRAAQSGDVNALVAALEEYQQTAAEALAGAGADEARREHVATQLARHVAVLEALTARVPERAAEAIRAAVDQAEARIRAMLEGPGGPVYPGGPEAKPTPRPKPEATAKPTPRPKPEATAKPTPRTNEAATPKPGRTPPGKPDETPGQEKSRTP